MKEYILNHDEIHCWVIDLDTHVSKAFQYLDLLNDAEKRRADRFVFKEHKERYIVSHGILNTLLPRYLNTSKFDLFINEYGKPFIKNSFLHFNLSHSNRYACIAIANFEVGVDIEHMKEEAVIESIFSKNERDLFEKIPGHLKLQAFYRAWVRKEAYLKALGIGLSGNIQEIEVGFKTPSEWSFIPIDIPEHYIGFIAAQVASSLKVKQSCL